MSRTFHDHLAATSVFTESALKSEPTSPEDASRHTPGAPAHRQLRVPLRSRQPLMPQISP